MQSLFPTDPLPARPSEELLVRQIADAAFDRPVRHVLAMSLGRAQAAVAAAERFPTASIRCNFLDLYRMTTAQLAVSTTAAPTRVRFTCEADFPPANGDSENAAGYDLALLPFTAQGDADLTRDLIQDAFLNLAEGGQLWTSTDNPADRWLRAELEKLFPRLRVRATEHGVVYSAVRTRPLKKRKDHSCWFAFRDGERLLRVYSRPGVFSHRKIDTGARSLIETMNIEAGMRVLDIGCGSGTVGFAAAARAPEVKVLAIDSNPRAVQCTRLGAAANDLPLVTASLGADVTVDAPGEYDVALANPPYYSHQRIASLFVHGAVRALQPDGQLLLVTKDPLWYDEFLPQWFDRTEILEVRSYFVIRATGMKNRP